MINPPQALIDRIAALLTMAVTVLHTQRTAGRITSALYSLFLRRFGTLKQRFCGLVGRIEAGTYRPRRAGPRRTPASREPPDPGRLPQQRGWLAAMLPEQEATYCRAQLFNLLAQPDMPVLIAAAPAAMRRTLRPLYWALGCKPPPVLAYPSQPRPEQPPPAAPAAPRAPARPPAPSWWVDPPTRTRWPGQPRATRTPKPA